MKFVLFVFTLFILWMPAAHAQSDESALLKGVFEEFIDKKSAGNEKNSRRQIKYEGEVTVEKLDDYYAITLPYASIHYPDGTKINIGIVSVNASKHQTPGQWKMTIAIPTPILGYDKNEIEIMRLTLGTQKAAGIWDETLKNFVKLDAQYSDIVFYTAAASANIKNMRTQYDFTKTENDRVSGPAYFEVSDVDWKLSHKSINGYINKFFTKFSIDQLAPKTIKDTLSLWNIINGAESTIGLRGFTLVRTNKNTPEGSEAKTEMLSLGSLDLSTSITDSLSGTANASTSLQFQGFNLQSPLNTKAAELFPSDGRIEIGKRNIPLKAINDTFSNAEASNFQIGMLGFVMKMPALLAQAGTFVEIKDTYLNGQDYKLDADGLVRADLTAASSISGNMKLRFHGLDTVLAKSQIIATQSAKTGQTENFKGTFSDIARLLEQIKPIGKVETSTEDGAGFVHVYDFALTPTGQITVNDKPLSLLFSARPVGPVEKRP